MPPPLAVLLSSLLVLVAPATPAPPDASALLSERDALAWVGGPLGETFEGAEGPTAENGHDHTTVRGWFPRGWNLRTAETPPARGVLLTVHRMRDGESAASFLSVMNGMHHEQADAEPGDALTFAALDSLGADAFAIADTAPVEGGRPVAVATVMLRRGGAVLHLQVWRAEGDADAVARRAARALAARLE